VRPYAGIYSHSKRLKRFCWPAILVWIWGCAVSYTLIKDFDSRKPHTVALLPVLNETNDLDAPEEMRPLIYEALNWRGYKVQEPAETDRLLRSRGIEEAGQIHEMSFQELGDLLQTEALLVCNVIDWSTVYLLAYSSITVEAEFRLIDVKTGQALWESREKASRRYVAIDKDSFVKTLEAAVKITYSSQAKLVIHKSFITLPYGFDPIPRKQKQNRHKRRKIILHTGSIS
jgi:hypothetical protein